MKQIEDFRDIQKISLKLLVVFDELCKKNKLQYYLAWGTLLGAIRHKGFIPWDDDIDLMMPRKDFNRLIELDIQQPAPGVRFYSHKQDNLYENINCRLSDEATLVDLMHIENPVKQGIWLTIFPIDNFPDNITERNFFLKKIYWKYKILLAITERKEFLDTRSWTKRVVIRLLKSFLDIRHRKRMYLSTHELMQSYNDYETKEVAILSIGTGNKTHFPKTCFEEVLQWDFEGSKYPIPSGYHEILTNTYGDYMQLPPVEERVPKHNFVAFYK